MRRERIRGVTWTAELERCGDPEVHARLEAVSGAPGQLGRWARWRLEQRRGM
jgi:hypothetical protein